MSNLKLIESTSLNEVIVPQISDTTAKQKAKRVIRELTLNANARGEYLSRLCDMSKKKGERNRYLDAYTRAYGSMCRLIYQDKKTSSFMRLTVPEDDTQKRLILAVDHFDFRRPEKTYSKGVVAITIHALQRLLQRYPQREITAKTVFDLTEEVANLAIFRTPVAREGVIHLDKERGSLAYVFDGATAVIKTYMPPDFKRGFLDRENKKAPPLNATGLFRTQNKLHYHQNTIRSIP